MNFFFSKKPKLNLMENKVVGTSHAFRSSAEFNSETSTSNINIYDMGTLF